MFVLPAVVTIIVSPLYKEKREIYSPPSLAILFKSLL
ncbi:hypothetical protein protein [Bacillus cereus G9241]|nr:hypothetical protein protein [Bacillus cereus G9241]